MLSLSLPNISTGLSGDFSSKETSLLRTDEEAMIACLSTLRPLVPSPMIVFTGTQRDPGDQSAFMVAAGLEKLGFVELVGAVTTLGEPGSHYKRAQFLDGLLASLGNHSCKIAVGRRTLDSIEERDVSISFDNPYPKSDRDIEFESNSMLKNALRNSPDKSVLVVVIAAVTDANDFFINPENESLFRQKVRHVTIVGEVTEKEIPSAQAYNFRVDLASAREFHNKLTQLGTPMTVVTRDAAYAAPVTTEYFESIGQIEHPAAIALQEIQMKALSERWSSIIAGEPKHFSMRKFFKLFTGLNWARQSDQRKIEAVMKQAQEESSFLPIWKKINQINLYNPLTIFGAIPEIKETFFVSQPKSASQTLVLERKDIKSAAEIKVALSALTKISCIQNDLSDSTVT